MPEKKILKARCKKYNKFYAIELRQVSSEWKATDFISVEESTYNLLKSEVKQDKFVVADNLKKCNVCNSSLVSGCDCAQKHSPCNKADYNFQCIHCNNLEIDYSHAKKTGGYKDGDTIILEQGQEVKLSFNDESLTKLYLGGGWDEKKFGRDIDVDFSAVLSNGQDYETVYFSHKVSNDNSILHHGDNLTGRDIPNHDDENISIDLTLVNPKFDRIILVLNIYECVSRLQSFMTVKNLFVRIYDPVSKNVLVEYRLSKNYGLATALIIGKVYKVDGEWYFKAIGESSHAKTIHSLASSVKDL